MAYFYACFQGWKFSQVQKPFLGKALAMSDVEESVGHTLCHLDTGDQSDERLQITFYRKMFEGSLQVRGSVRLFLENEDTGREEAIEMIVFDLERVAEQPAVRFIVQYLIGEGAVLVGQSAEPHPLFDGLLSYRIRDVGEDAKTIEFFKHGNRPVGKVEFACLQQRGGGHNIAACAYGFATMSFSCPIAD